MDKPCYNGFMSPHNNTRFNGSAVNSPSSYHSDQRELGLAMGRLTDRVNRGLFKYSGLESFKSRRFFKRGLANQVLTLEEVTPRALAGDKKIQTNPL
jgi:hypothetical protein